MGLIEKIKDFACSIKEKLKTKRTEKGETIPFVIRLIKDGKTIRTLSSGDNAERQAENYSIFCRELLNYNFETVCDINEKQVTFYFIPKKNDIKKAEEE